MSPAAIDPRTLGSGGCHVIYDANAIAAPGNEFFDPAHWRKQHALLDTATGRGTTVSFRAGDADYVLRHYLRGGLIQRLSHDRYLWTGLDATRAWREWRLLADMWRAGLPVPRPVAARVERGRWWYRADLVTARIADTRTLINRLGDAALAATQWRAIGACIRRFHDAGIFHADLNARNILLDTDGQVFLLDFDRGERRPPAEAWQQGNLARLKRSLAKHAGTEPLSHYAEDDFALLLAGYRGDQAR
jgi:3-deoxy-D-manno-octulosonic acid kinase